MSTQVFTTSSPDRPSRGKTTGDQVVEFKFDASTYMISPHPEHGGAIKVTMQGQCLAIDVATVSFKSFNEISDITWETPFSGRNDEWKQALLSLVINHCFRSLPEAVVA